MRNVVEVAMGDSAAPKPTALANDAAVAPKILETTASSIVWEQGVLPFLAELLPV